MYNSLINVIFKEKCIVLAEFQNGEIKSYDFKKLFLKYPIYKKLENETIFKSGRIAPGGCGLIFNDEIDIAAEEIYSNGLLVETKNISDINILIANMVSKARNEKNMTQSELAKVTKIHQAEISKIERGIGNPSIKTLNRIAEGLGLKLELFIRWHFRKSRSM